MVKKVDDATIAELRRLSTAPGHDRMGMMAKGCMLDLLDELAELRAFHDMMHAPLLTVPEEPESELEGEEEVEALDTDLSLSGSFSSSFKLVEEDDEEDYN